MSYSRILIFFFFIIHTFASFSQVGEGGNDCTLSKEIDIPFNSPDNPNAPKHSLNQTVFYGYHDQFTFWYKIVVKENATLSYKVTALNDSDTYAVYVYQYNQVDFCNKLYYDKIPPVKPSFFLNGNKGDDPYDLSKRSFAAVKGNTYYISVLNTSLNNCGHNFSLVNGKDTLRVKALHLPCKRDVSTLITKSIAIKSTLKNPDTVVAKIFVPGITSAKLADTSKNTMLVCVIKDSKKNTLLKIKPYIIEQSTKNEIPVMLSENGEWSCMVEKGKSYKIKTVSLGYKGSEQIVEINKAFTKLDILLEPLKAGDFFIMKSIYFFPNTYALKKESATELQKLLSFLQDNDNVTIEIQGHTNGDHRIVKNKAYASLGEEWNFQGSAKELSQKRAEAIKNYLENNGVTNSRLIPKGYGGKKPIIKDPQDNEEGQMNIRVEIVILKS